MTRKVAPNVEKVAKKIIRLVSELDIDESYKVGVFGALLTKYLISEKSPIQEQRQTRVTKPRSDSLTNLILALRDDGFFRQPKSNLDVHSEASKSYPCVRTRVSVALIRLAKRRELRRAETVKNGKRVVAYAW